MYFALQLKSIIARFSNLLLSYLLFAIRPTDTLQAFCSSRRSVVLDNDFTDTNPKILHLFLSADRRTTPQ